ncbi:hypothetical protein [Eisenbergiella tayi]|uniref:hypothetical protein n=1 Tax=Eisenbergiella tayi TaxID=1432052 RepID=UPI0004AFE8B2|nr:hypothetical protein [Eisenbergiella tayi]
MLRCFSGTDCASVVTMAEEASEKSSPEDGAEGLAAVLSAELPQAIRPVKARRAARINIYFFIE